MVISTRRVPRRGPPNIPHPGFEILGERPFIVPPEVICLYAGTRALSPKGLLLVSVFQILWIKGFFPFHQCPGDHQELCRKLYSHLGFDPLFLLPSYEPLCSRL